jgi:hypothetical protein
MENKFLKKMNIKGNTQAWVMQVWASFALSIMFGVVAIFSLPTANYERLVMAIAFLFTLSTTFTLAKTIRDNRDERVDTSQWILQTWASFGIASSLTVWSFFRLNIDDFHKLFLACDWFFLLMSTFTLAKTIRDNHEHEILEQTLAPKTFQV